MNRLVLTLALALAAPISVPASAQGVFVPPPPSVVQGGPQLDDKRARVSREMGYLGVNADISRLSNSKVALIDATIHGNLSVTEQRNMVRSILSRGILQRTIDRFGNGG